MNRNDKQKQVFKQLINQQLLPYGKTYEDVVADSRLLRRHQTTPEAEKNFVTWGVEFLKQELGLTTKMAENEMSWFILQWGLTTVSQPIAEPAVKATRSERAK